MRQVAQQNYEIGQDKMKIRGNTIYACGEKALEPYRAAGWLFSNSKTNCLMPDRMNHNSFQEHELPPPHQLL